tara:strand:+ start:1047 stop:4223 length:3177 start_codon:yes stop_codon:yes gene_type:complete
MPLSWKNSDGDTITTTSVNAEITGTFTFLDDDVSAMYVDWDDGESNKKTEANYQWAQYTEPVSSATLKHTYTQTTDTTFNPVIQTISSNGFASRYYSNESSNDDVSPFSQNTAISGMAVTDGTATAIMRVENTTVKSGIDNTVFERDGPRPLYVIIPPTLTSTELGYLTTVDIEITALVAQSTVGAGVDLMVGEMAGKVNTGYSLSIMTGLAQLSSLTTTTSVHQVDFGIDASVSRVLSVKYRNPKITGTYERDYTRNSALNNLKIFLVAFADEDLNDNIGQIYPITYVSAGSPFKSTEDPTRYISMDFSQSRAAASNVTNSYYRYDNGKGNFGAPFQQWALSSDKFTDATKQSGAIKTVYYTYNPRPAGIGGESDGTMGSTVYTMPWGSGTQAVTTDANCRWIAGASAAERTNQFAVDEYGRFFDQYHLVRDSVEPSSGDTYISSLSGNKVTLARITPVLNVEGTNNQATKLDITGTTGCYTADYTAAAFNNSGGADGSGSGLVSLSGMNSGDFEGWDGVDREANEYLIALWDAKTNKIFFQCTPWWSGSYDSTQGDLSDVTGLKIAGLSYLRVLDKGTVKQTCEWVPLEFVDTTTSTLEYRNTSDDPNTYTQMSNSFTKPGYVSFDMPSDWGSIKMRDLYGGQRLTGSAATEVAVINQVNTVNDTGSVLAANNKLAFTVEVDSTVLNKTSYGDTVILKSPSGDTDAIRTAMDYISTGSGYNTDVGAFKYMVEVVTDDGNGLDLQNLWLAYAYGDNKYRPGYYRASAEADDRLYLHFGDTEGSNYVIPTGGDTLKIIVKRINFYEVFPGASKLYKNGVFLNPVDAGDSAFPNKYGFEDYAAGAGEALQSAWGGTEKYPLMVSISGAMGVAPGGSTTNIAYPEIWNVFDATQGFTALVKQEDDSAYNLNSLSITSDLSVGRASNFYQAITRKGKVFITQTGIGIQEVGFSSVALGDENGATISGTTEGSLYNHLRMIRKIQSDVVPVYWDQKQKDGTWVRMWGFIKDVNETYGTGGPRKVVRYTFTLIIKEIALLNNGGELMTNIFPLGGVFNEQDYT